MSEKRSSENRALVHQGATSYRKGSVDWSGWVIRSIYRMAPLTLGSVRYPVVDTNARKHAVFLGQGRAPCGAVPECGSIVAFSSGAADGITLERVQNVYTELSKNKIGS